MSDGAVVRGIVGRTMVWAAATGAGTRLLVTASVTTVVALVVVRPRERKIGIRLVIAPAVAVVLEAAMAAALDGAVVCPRLEAGTARPRTCTGLGSSALGGEQWLFG